MALERLSDEAIKEALALHRQWLNDDFTGKRAEFIGLDLTGCVFEEDLRRARFDNSVLTEANFSLANLAGASFAGTYSEGACFRYCDLQKATFFKAELIQADFHDTDMRDTLLSRARAVQCSFNRADLKFSSLNGTTLTNSSFFHASLNNTYIDKANFIGATGLEIANDSEARLKAVAQAALAPGALEMEDFHTCDTTHCIAGWAIHQAGEPGRLLEKAMGPAVAGLMLLGPEAALHFYDDNEEAYQWLKTIAAKDNAPA